MRLGVNGMIERPRHRAGAPLAAGAAGMARRAGRPARSWLAAGALLALAALPAPAQEALPQPQVDFAAEGTFTGGGRMVLRHHGGLLRMEMTMPGVPAPLTGYFNLAAKKALMVLATPAGRMAMEVSFADQAAYGAMVGKGVREGRDTVAGEPCEVWRIEAARAEEPVHSCITGDGIALRTDAMVAGKRHTVFEIVSLSRAAQDPAAFQMPTDVPVVKLPMPSPAPPVAPPPAVPAR
jgi:hypothetical protein